MPLIWLGSPFAQWGNSSMVPRSIILTTTSACCLIHLWFWFIFPLRIFMVHDYFQFQQIPFLEKSKQNLKYISNLTNIWIQLVAELSLRTLLFSSSLAHIHHPAHTPLLLPYLLVRPGVECKVGSAISTFTEFPLMLTS